MKKLLVGIGITFFISLVGNVYQWSAGARTEARAESLEKQKESLQGQLEAKQNNTEEQMKAVITDFSKSFFTWKGEQGNGHIERYVTRHALETLRPLGGKPSASKVDVASKLDEVTVYYSPVTADTATSLVRVYRTMTVNGVSSRTSLLLEIQTKYDTKKKEWLIDNMKILTELSDTP